MTRIFAHRGASGYRPENTLEAFALADAMGADGVELDVQLTKDGEVVVAHDETIDRVSDHKGLLSSYTLAELKSFNFGGQHSSEQIPLLSEVLELLKPTGMEINIELKTGLIWYPDLEEKTIQLVEEFGMEDRVIYSSFNHYSIQKVKRLSPSARTGYLFSDVILDAEKYTKEGGVEAMHLPYPQLLMPHLLKRYRESGLFLRLWTVNEEKYLDFFLKEKVEALITNYPDRAIAIRDRLLKNKN